MSHQAHAFLDVAMLPEINIYSEPQFPNCKKNPSGKLNVLVTCAIKNTTEKYNISWYDQDFVPDSTSKLTILQDMVMVYHNAVHSVTIDRALNLSKISRLPT